MALQEYTKVCSVCKLPQPITKYRWRPASQGKGLRAQCSDCESEYQRTADRRRYQEKWRLSNTIKTSAYRRKRVYGMSRQDYVNMLEAQGRKCPICSSDLVDSAKTTHVDHDHETGHIRGLLCGTCNQGLGNFKENPDFLKSAVKYLRKHGR